jgi:hypothetical protein
MNISNSCCLRVNMINPRMASRPALDTQALERKAIMKTAQP